MKSLVLSAAALTCSALGLRADVVRAIDLGDEAQRRAQPAFAAVSHDCRVAERVGPSGRWNYRFRVTKPWCGELPKWPSVNLIPKVTDWTPYDRLVVDIFNDSTGGDVLFAYLSQADGRIQNGMLSRGLPLDDGGYTRWTIPLRGWPKTCDPKRIGRVHFFMTTPASADIWASGFYLLKPGEEPPPPDVAFLDGTLRPAREKAERLARARRAASIDRFVAKCRAAGQTGAQGWFGQATAMERVCPRNDFDIAPATALSLRLARDEWESLQVFVLPNGHALTNVSVTVSDLTCGGATLPAAAFRAVPLGYVRTVSPAPYRIGANVATNLPGGYFRLPTKARMGWWPDPILDHLNVATIRDGDLQGFWVRLKCPAAQPAGLYKGTLSVSGNGWRESFPLAVRVWDFAVPKRSALPLAVTFGPSPSTQFADAEQLALNKRLRADPNAPINAWRRHKDEWADFLADYGLGMDSLYHGGQVDWDVLLKRKAEGRLGLFNIGYWMFPGDLSDAGKAAWRTRVERQFGATYRKAKELGLLRQAYFYGCDETPPDKFENIRWAIAELKRMFPGVPLSTTAYDHAFGVNTPLEGMDWFTPTTDKFEENLAAVAPSRAAGHEVWWYIACGQQAPRANLFVEGQPIEARQLMGAQAVKFRPDGFLYYQTSIWNATRCIDGPSTFTDWDPRSWTTFHGDGSWFCCGPDGRPCATVRIENFRDGFEDYAYAMEYERVTGHRAKVPASVCRSVWQYTDDPKAYYAWRDALAETIEQAKHPEGAFKTPGAGN